MNYQISRRLFYTYTFKNITLNKLSMTTRITMYFMTHGLSNLKTITLYLQFQELVFESLKYGETRNVESFGNYDSICIKKIKVFLWDFECIVFQE